MSNYIGITGRIYPNDEQRKTITLTAHHSRFVWNQFLECLNKRYENNKNSSFLTFGTMSCILTQLKREYPWLNDAESSALQGMTKRLHETFTRFFKRQSDYPKFKKRNDYNLSYTSTIRGKGEKANIRLNDTQTKILLPKLGWMRVRLSRRIENQKIKSATVRTSSSGYVSISLLVEHENQVLPQTRESIGIDVGLIDYASLSNGEKLNLLGVNPDTQEELQKAQRTLNKRIHRAKKKQGKNWRFVRGVQKAQKRVSRLHLKIKNQRKDALHKLTTQLVKEYDLIAIEDLKSANLMKNKHIARSVANASWRMFRTFLSYKCKMYGKECVAVSPHFTTVDCSNCGHRGASKPLHIREWTCEICGAHHDRDTNAAINILKKGLAQMA